MHIGTIVLACLYACPPLRSAIVSLCSDRHKVFLSTSTITKSHQTVSNCHSESCKNKEIIIMLKMEGEICKMIYQRYRLQLKSHKVAKAIIFYQLFIFSNCIQPYLQPYADADTNRVICSKLYSKPPLQYSMFYASKKNR